MDRRYAPQVNSIGIKSGVTVSFPQIGQKFLAIGLSHKHPDIGLFTTKRFPASLKFPNPIHPIEKRFPFRRQ
jgi:hypothetical protein